MLISLWIDYRICSWVCLMFFALQLDRGNISQALSDNLLDGESDRFSIEWMFRADQRLRTSI